MHVILWELSYYAVCNSERIIEIGQYLQKLCSNEHGSSFLLTVYILGQSPHLCVCLRDIRQVAEPCNTVRFLLSPMSTKLWYNDAVLCTVLISCYSHVGTKMLEPVTTTACRLTVVQAVGWAIDQSNEKGRFSTLTTPKSLNRFWLNLKLRTNSRWLPHVQNLISIRPHGY